MFKSASGNESTLQVSERKSLLQSLFRFTKTGRDGTSIFFFFFFFFSIFLMFCPRNADTYTRPVPPFLMLAWIRRQSIVICQFDHLQTFSGSTGREMAAYLFAFKLSREREVIITIMDFFCLAHITHLYASLFQDG